MIEELLETIEEHLIEFANQDLCEGAKVRDAFLDVYMLTKVLKDGMDDLKKKYDYDPCGS